MAATGVGAGCLVPSVRLRLRADPAARVTACVVRARLRRVARGRYVAELSREGPAARPAQQQQLAPPVVPGFLAPPPPAPAQSPAPTQPPLPDAGVGELAPDLILEGITEDSIDSIVVAASEQDSEIMDAKDQPLAKVTRSIVFVTGEAAPYAKSGGLGDVCGSLPIALAARGHRVMVVMPRYLNGTSDKNYAKALYTGKHIKIPCFGGSHEVTFFHEYRDNVDWVFVDHPSYHRPGSLYGDNFGAFGDNQFRYTLLCYAACEAPLILELGGYIYGQSCMFVVNDWHASLVPVYVCGSESPILYSFSRLQCAHVIIHFFYASFHVCS